MNDLADKKCIPCEGNIPPFKTEEIHNYLKKVDGWEVKKDKLDGHFLTKQFKFDNFIEAFGFMTNIALMAEKINHHPEWFNVYSRVDVVLTTHDLNAVSELDITLAEHMDNFASNFLLDRV